MIRLDVDASDLSVGESIMVNGVCLTAIDPVGGAFAVDVSPETLRATDLGRLKKDDRVNLERAMRPDDRLGGHLVTGHVDAVGILRRREAAGNAWVLTVEAPPHVMRYCVPKGSIAVDGISLTVNEVGEKEFSVSIIPHTAEVTTIGSKRPGDEVNLEADLVGKYVERLLEGKAAGAGSFVEALRKFYDGFSDTT